MSYVSKPIMALARMRGEVLFLLSPGMAFSSIEVSTYALASMKTPEKCLLEMRSDTSPSAFIVFLAPVRIKLIPALATQQSRAGVKSMPEDLMAFSLVFPSAFSNKFLVVKLARSFVDFML